MLGMASLLHHRKCVIMGACLCLAGLGTLQLNVRRPILVDEITEKERDEVGCTPYFQALCKRSDILPLPLNCSRVSNANLTDDADYSRLPLFLDCYNNISAKTAKTVNFFSFAHGDVYLDMLPLYAFFALSSNPNSVVEMVVKNQTDFYLKHAKELMWIMAHFDSSSVCVRNMAHNVIQRTEISNTWRYLEKPVRHAQYTYIGDVDIFMTESVLDDTMRMDQMKTWNIPYSNIVRPNTTRLTGVMLMRTDDFYTPKLLELQQTVNAKGNDEMVLYRIVNASRIGLPPDASDDDLLSKYRPLHGVHLSTNRGPGKSMCLSNFKSHLMWWCVFLSTPLLEELLCVASSNIVMDSIHKITTQMKHNMTHKTKRICS